MNIGSTIILVQLEICFNLVTFIYYCMNCNGIYYICNCYCYQLGWQYSQCSQDMITRLKNDKNFVSSCREKKKKDIRQY